jgi:1,4-alpha-glucan branching enzyme
MLILHAHLPFVRHPGQARMLEEDWFHEAFAGSHLQILGMLDHFARDGIHAPFTLGITAPLAAMMRDPLLATRFSQYLDDRLAFAAREGRSDDVRVRELARFHEDQLLRARTVWQRGDVLERITAHAEAGRVELMMSAATHGFLPLLCDHPGAARAQVLIGADAHRALFGRSAPGIWLPECGYRAEIEPILREAGVRWFVLESHGLHHADPRPPAGVFAPVTTPCGLAAFARDPDTARRVWSAESGYPGHPLYAEFHRDLVHEREAAELGPLVNPAGFRHLSGFRHRRITGPGNAKDWYDPAAAAALAREHALDFLSYCAARLGTATSQQVESPTLLAPFDAELFGHWWREGPQFLEALLRAASQPGAPVRLATPSGFLAKHPPAVVVQPAASTWGRFGFSSTWAHPSNAWMLPLLHAASQRMQRAATHWHGRSGAPERFLRQAALELLLAQSSDWAFLSAENTAPHYARMRVEEHLARLHKLLDAIEHGDGDPSFVRECEACDSLLPDLDWTRFAPDAVTEEAP